MKFLLSTITSATGGVLEGPDAVADGACIDSRLASAGMVFFAMPGARTDGHAFVPEVLALGAYAVVSGGPALPGTIRVRSVPDALLEAGSAVRSTLEGRVVAVTGSSGKTTTRELLSLALSPAYRTDSSRGNLNNRIGLPLSILNLDEDARAFVLELGMNHAGELLELGSVVRPDASVITNVGTAHIEFFDGHDSLAAAKAELLDTTAGGGICVIPSGEPVLLEAARRNSLDCTTVGPDGDFRLVSEGSGARIEPLGLRVVLSVTGSHLLEDAALAIVAAMRMGVDPVEAARAVEGFAGLPGRGRIFVSGGMTVVDESYNANPESMKACLEALSHSPGRRGAVLGDMLELGGRSTELHYEVLRKAACCGLEFVVLVGPGMRDAATALSGSGARVEYADDPEEALERLSAFSAEGLRLLVKGSHSIGLDRIVDVLREGVRCSTGSCTR